MNTNYNCNNKKRTKHEHYWLNSFCIFISVVLSISIWIHANECKKQKEERKKRQQSALSMPEKGRERRWIKRSPYSTRAALNFSYFDICAVCWLTRRKFTTVHPNKADTLTVSQSMFWKRPRAEMSVCQNLFGVPKTCAHSHTKRRKKSISTKLYQWCWIFRPNAMDVSAKSYIRYCRHDRWWCCCWLWLWVWWSIIHGLWNKLKSINAMCPGRMSV